MRYLQELTAYLVKNAFLKEKFESWAEDGEIIYGSHQVIQGYEVKYTANFEALNVQVLPSIFFGLVTSWLSQHNPNRDQEGLESPKFFIQERLGSGRFDLGLKLDFIEKYEYTPSEDGQFIINGQRVDPISDYQEPFNKDAAEELLIFDSHSQDSGLKNE